MSGLDQKSIARAKEVACEAFPEMADVEPEVSSPRTVHGKAATSFHILTFRKSISLPDGGCLAQVVRVMLDESGEIVRVSCSK